MLKKQAVYSKISQIEFLQKITPSLVDGENGKNVK